MDAIEYYNRYASKFFEDTVDQDVEEERQEFSRYLEESDTILDLGCGSGRDGQAFYDQGFDVTLLDASEEMCKLAEIHTGLEVLCMTYEAMDFDDVFDGVWGRDALIHIPKSELPDRLNQIADSLHLQGLLYLSFPEGSFEGAKGEQYICEYGETEIPRLMTETGRFQIVKTWITDWEGTKDGGRRIHVMARRES